MKKTLRLFVTGSIQPIFYHRFIKDNADKIGIRGFVRNLDDGRIEIIIEGDTEAMNRMAPLCRRGPQHSVIRKVEEKEEKFQDFRDFKILEI